MLRPQRLLIQRSSLLLLATVAMLAAGPAATLEEGDGDHFRISLQGGTGNEELDAFDPKVAFNPSAEEYLVVWEGTNDLCGGDGSPDREVFAQRVDASTGNRIGDAIMVSRMEPAGCSPPHRALDPAVVYNATADEYLVVFEGDRTEDGLVSGEREIWGQRLSGNLADPLTPDNFRISDAGGIGDPAFDTTDPAVVWNATDNEYLVVWSADDNSGGLVQGEEEIFGQRLDATGAPVGANDFRISDSGGTGDGDFGSLEPDVAWNENENEYLVVWWGDDNVNGIVNNQTEIFGQRLDADGSALGANDFPITLVSETPDFGFFTLLPAVAHNTDANEYLVAWMEVIEQCSERLDEEIFARRVDGKNGSILGSQIEVSEMSPTGCAPAAQAGSPSVVYNELLDEYLVIWSGDQVVPGGVVNDEFEIWGQRLTGDGAVPIGTNDFRISEMGGTGDTDHVTSSSDLTWNSDSGEYLAVWSGTDDEDGLVVGEYEIFGELLGENNGGSGAPPCLPDENTACLLDGRFEVKVQWTDFQSGSGSGKVMTFGNERAESDESVFFWFFGPANFEMGVKMVDACGPPFDTYWAFVSGLTNVAFAVTIRDTETGATKVYSNPLGELPKTVGDVQAFGCDP